jgi:hypothetical protein
VPKAPAIDISIHPDRCGTVLRQAWFQSQSLLFSSKLMSRQFLQAEDSTGELDNQIKQLNAWHEIC